MTSTTTGLPDRYRPLDQVGPDEPTPTGVIRCFRARDRVLNRDVAVRVHTPAGAAAHEWITRALTAGGLATPALAMVYDASEGAGDPQAPGGAAYVVNEWIDGETLADRLGRGPMPDREVRTVLRRLAEGVAEAHRVGLAVGGLNPDNVVLRPNGLVGLRAVPAATGTIDGDITALGSLLESCLTGLAPGAERSLSGPSDLVALARRARSTEPGQGLSSVAAMAALLAERPRGHSTGPTAHVRADESDSSWLRRLRDRRAESPASTGEAPSDTAEESAVKLDPETLPPVPGSVPAAGAAGATAATAAPSSTTTPAVPPAVASGSSTDRDGSTTPDGSAPPSRTAASGVTTGRGGDDYEDEEPFGVLHADEPAAGDDPADEDDGRKHRGLVVGLPLLALVVVVALAWWFGSTVLSVTDSVDDLEGSTPSASAPAASEEGADEAEDAGEGTTAAGPVAVGGAEVFDPFGDGAPENDPEVPLSYDGDPATGWSTLTYQGSPALGNLKPGVGVRYDLGEAQALAGVTVATSTPGATVEIRAGDEPVGAVESYPVVAQGTLEGTTEFAFDEPVTGRYVLVWITELVPSGDGFAAELSEVTVTAAG